MAKKRYEELKADPSIKRGSREYSSRHHHEFIVTNKLGGRNLYLDEDERNKLIDAAIKANSGGQGYLNRHTVLESIFPPKTFAAPPRSLPSGSLARSFVT